MGLCQGLLIGLYLLRKRKWHPSQYYLILFLMVVGMQLTFKVLSKSWLWKNVELVYQLSYSLPFLVGPLVYLFLNCRLTNKSFRLTELGHVIPFLLSLIHSIFAYYYNQSYMPDFFWQLFPWPTLQYVSLMVYGVLSVRVLQKKISEKESSGLRQFLYLTLIVEVLIVTAIAVLSRYHKSMPDIRLVFVALTLLIYWITFQLMNNQQLLVALPASLPSERNPMKYVNSGLKMDEASRIETLLIRAIDEKFFLEPDLPMAEFASRLGVSRHHLSQVLNERFGKNYQDLIYSHRLEEAKIRLVNTQFAKETISNIAYDTGFTSVSSFTIMFKRHFGVTPGQYRQQFLKG